MAHGGIIASPVGKISSDPVQDGEHNKRTNERANDRPTKLKTRLDPRKAAATAHRKTNQILSRLKYFRLIALHSKLISHPTPPHHRTPGHRRHRRSLRCCIPLKPDGNGSAIAFGAMFTPPCSAELNAMLIKHFKVLPSIQKFKLYRLSTAIPATTDPDPDPDPGVSVVVSPHTHRPVILNYSPTTRRRRRRPRQRRTSSFAILWSSTAEETVP